MRTVLLSSFSRGLFFKHLTTNERTTVLRLNRDMSSTVYITRKLPEDIFSKLKESGITVSTWMGDDPVPREKLISEVKGKDGLLCLLTDKIDSSLLDAAGAQLKVVSTMSVGYDHIQLPALKERKVRLGFTPDVLTDATAELTMALLLTTSRRIPEAIESVKDGSWGAWKPFWLCGSGLSGSTVGIVGMGRIGQAVAKRLAPFCVKRMLFTGSGARRTVDLGSEDVKMESVAIEELLRESDFVVACCALNERTKGMFDDKAFSLMKPSAIFVNTSRGGVVDQEALYRALESGRIGAAGLDVTTPEPLPTDSPLLSLKNCVVLPHIGSATLDTRRAMAQLAVDNLIAGLKGTNSPMPAEVQL